MTSRNFSLDSLIDLANNMRAELDKLQEHPVFSVEERETLFNLVIDIRETFYEIADLCIPK